MSRRELPLTIEIRDAALVIEIGVEILAHIIECSPDDRLAPYDDAVGDYLAPRVEDPEAFAEEFVEELHREEEDGSTLVKTMLDNAAVQAIDNGAEGIEFPVRRSTTSEARP